MDSERDKGIATDTTPERRARRGRLWVGGLVVGAVALTAAGAFAGTVIKSPAQVAADAAPPPPDVLTAPVERRVLHETVVLRGTVVAGQTVPVAPVVSGGDGGTPVVTKTPVTVGAAVRKGQVVLEISGRPLFVLPGRLPVYRDLKPGATGDDVAQLQTALAGLGFDRGGDPKGTFGEGTKAAVEGFYAAAGYDPRPAVDDEGAGVDAASDAVTAAERAVDDARDALAENKDEDRRKSLRKARDRAAEDLVEARTALGKVWATAGPMVPAGEVVFVERFPARIASTAVAPGSPVSGTLLTLSSGRLLAQGHLQDHQKGMVRPGQRVRVLDEVTGAELTAEVGTVASTRTVADAKQGGGQGAGQGQDGAPPANGPTGFLFTAVPEKDIPPALAGQDVRLTIEAASTDGEALVVPVTAVSASADGRTVVTVVDGNGRRTPVEVRTGTLGDGYVEVVPLTAGSLAEGAEVMTGVAATGAALDGRGQE
ncbi:peptidoglycan-binding domain-containing protein [Streptomyces sp. NBC_00572]|uniref:peptidoglycan-binding domain-containing protein n=1 Tax=Streptomyces sp. NBC_00572 TaxID=2903664 RepID=UPI0022542DA5|nr:peptidoglycan-binding domain-containing protein [Streptomyces sp. NBC_00572]MCX4982715.1 peptidoglycan-binding protein [Streptomyces sp. NBC_00572]